MHCLPAGPGLTPVWPDQADASNLVLMEKWARTLLPSPDSQP